MKQEAVQLLNKGMRQDESISKAPVEYAFENHNIRLVQSNDNTYLSITNEQNPEAALLWKQESATVQKGYYIEAVEVNNPVDPDILEWKLRVTDPETQQIIWVNNIGWVGNIPLTIEYWIDPERENELSFMRQHLFTWALTEEELQVINTEVTINGQLYYTKVTLPPDLYTEFLSSEPQEGQPEPTPLGKFLYCSNTVKLEHEELYLPTPTEQTTMRGRLLGVNESSKYCTLFTVEYIDGGKLNHIYRLEYGDHLSDEVISPGINVFELYSGDLNITNKVETLFYYENENIQKVYWVDGDNSPRFINIANNLGYMDESSSIFDFSPTINTIPTVTITKDYSYSGLFAQGVIQYFISYYNKFFAETKLVYASSLQYLSFKDRGAKEDENVYCGFKIDLRDLDTNFEYARIYSVQRTSQDGPVVAKIVTDIAIQQDGTASFVDLGTSGEVIDPNLLYYIGGQDLIAGTLDSKDDVLFLGDITLKNTFADSSIETLLRDRIEYVTDTTEQHAEDIRRCMDIYWGYKSIPTPTPQGYYAYEQEINKSEKEIAGFKRGEIYRFAVQFMTSTGAWTSPVWIGDSECTLAPKYDEETNSYMVPCPAWDLTRDSNATETIINLITSKDYKASRLLYAHTDYTTRKILAQGVINPTLFNYYERSYNQPYSIASWNFRPRGGELAWKHYQNIGHQYSEYSELQGVIKEAIPMYKAETKDIHDHFKYYSAFLGLDPGHQFCLYLMYFSIPEESEGDAESFFNSILAGDENIKFKHLNHNETQDYLHNGYYVIKTVAVNKGSWKKAIPSLIAGIKDAHTELINTIYYPNIPTQVGECPILASLPNNKLCREIMSWRFGSMIWASLGAALVAAAGVALSVVSFGTLSGPSAAATGGVIAAITAMMATIGGISGGAMGIAIAVLGVAGVTKCFMEDAESRNSMKGAERKMLEKGYMCCGSMEQVRKGLDKMLENLPTLKKPFNGGVFWVTGGKLNVTSFEQEDVEGKQEQYYVDNSVVTLNSPEFQDTQDIIDNNSSIDLRIVGAVPIKANYTDYYIEGEGTYSASSKVLKGVKTYNAQLSSKDTYGLVSDYLYQDGQPGTPSEEHISLVQQDMTSYKVYLWNRPFLSMNGSHIATVKYKEGNIEVIDANHLVHKIFANQKFSFNTTYFDAQDYWVPNIPIDTPRMYYDDKNLINIPTTNDILFYKGNYDTLVPFTSNYPIVTVDNVDITPDGGNDEVGVVDIASPYNHSELVVNDAVRVKFDATTHAVINFSTQNGLKHILPKLSQDEDFSMESIYNGSLRDNETPFNYIIDKYDEEAYYSSPWSSNFNNGSVINEMTRVIVKGDETLTIDMREVLAANPGLTWEDFFVIYPYTRPTPSIQTGDNCYSLVLTQTGHGDTEFNFIDLIPEFSSWGYGATIYNWLFKLQNTNYRFIFNLVLSDTEKMCCVMVGGFTNGDPWIELRWKPETTEHVSTQTIEGVPVEYDVTVPQSPFYSQFESVDPAVNAISGIIDSSLTDGKLYVLIPDNHNTSEVTGFNGLGKLYPVYGDVGIVDELLEFHEGTDLSEVEGYPYLYLGELYKKNFQYSTLYGGYSDYAIQRIQWVPCSEPNYNLITVDNTWGDTFYQRWDCLKSYPSTEEDQNSIVEILSFMVESHINLDGRCDVNRGLSNIINARPTNWNLMNKVYSQENNLFQYAVLDDKFKTNRFSNEIIWSLNKKSVSDIDTWSNITALSSLFLDGQYGPVNKILNNNGSLLTFQDKAIAVVNFNNRTQLSTEQGVPIEVANSGKVNGYTYVDTTSGAMNKWTICKTRNGIYYADSYNKQFRVFNGEGAKDLGLDKGMSNFFKQAIDVEYNNYTTYDISTGDVYFKDFGDKPTIAYNESIGSFTSFYPMYDDILFYNLSGHEVGFSINDFIVEAIYPRQDQHWGEFYMIYKVNPEPLVDKIFSTIEYVGDVYSTNYSDYPPNSGYLEDVPPINGIDVYNEYQDTGFVKVTEDPDLSDISKRKFRIRRIQIPRDVLDANAYGLNRIRNPWCMVYLQGGDEDNENLRVQLHSIVVKYFK